MSTNNKDNQRKMFNLRCLGNNRTLTQGRLKKCEKLKLNQTQKFIKEQQNQGTEI